MQEYLQESRFRRWMDALGFHVAAAALCTGWFIFLWGFTLPACLAGAGLTLLIVMVRQKTRDGRLKRREKNLRRRIGGELALEKLLLCDPLQAHEEMAALLSRDHPLAIEKITPAGALCRMKAETILIAFCPLPSSATVHAEQVLALQRDCSLLNAHRGVLCAPCSLSSDAYAQADSPLPVTMLSREALIARFGRFHPATDAQLVALGRRRKRPSMGQWLPLILQPGRAPRYGFYGALLLGLYTLTHRWYYALPGLICVSLAVTCRCLPPAHSKL